MPNDPSFKLYEIEYLFAVHVGVAVPLPDGVYPVSHVTL